ncbi:MAG: leucine-rich repeat domain-containing protein [Bacteroidales bacterium]|nr:leucine-rich repeat domain-containing protein [Bacteroidales bacterium]
MKKIAILSMLLLAFAYGSQAQKLSKDEIAKYENEIQTMLTYLEETMNFIGDSTTSALEKEIVFTESWSKVFIDDKVQIEDDLDVNRKTPINKDVQAYLKDIDFFFKWANFKFDLQSIANSTRDDGSIFFKATLTRHLTATTITDEQVDNVRNRFVEINLDRQNNSIKIASIYTTKINEKEALRNWWNGLSMNWKSRLGSDIKLYDSIPMETVGMISSADFMASYPVTDPVTGETMLKDKFFKNDMAELDAKLKLVTQKQRVDLSGIREIINLDPLSELSDLTWLDISGTSIDDLSPIRNLNKMKVLRANSTLIEDLSALKYNITLEELEVANTTVDNLGMLASLRNLQKLNLADTQVSRITNLKNCPNLIALNLSGTRIANIGILQELPQLKALDISNTSVRDLGPVSNLKDLQSLNISGTAVTNLQALGEMENLRELYCSNTSISDLSPLKSHRRLGKIYCDHTKIGDAEASAFTKDNPFTLVIFDTEALRSWWNNLPLYWKAVFSKQIQVDSEPSTEQLHQIINLQELDLSGNTFMQNLMPVSRLTNLRSLNISHTEIGFLQPIQGLANLQSLDISHTYINDLKPLQDMGNLRYLNIMNTPVTDLSALSNDDRIEVIDADSTAIDKSQVVALKESQRQVIVVYQTEALKTWWNGLNPIWQAIFRNAIATPSEMPDALELQQIADLRELEITPEFPIISIEPLTSLIWLERLTINNQSVSDLKPLANKEFLLELNVQNNPVGSLKPIEESTLLELLNIENTQVDDLGPLSKMNNLVTLNASGTPVKSLKPLSGLQKLENLFVNNTSVRSISPVENIPTLKQLKVYNTRVKKRAVESLQQKRLDLNIIYY